MLLHYQSQEIKSSFDPLFTLLHYLGKLTMTSDRYLSNVMKISAKINTMQNINILLFVH